MASIMQKLRDNPPAELAGHKVVKVTDYKKPGGDRARLLQTC